MGPSLSHRERGWASARQRGAWIPSQLVPRPPGAGGVAEIARAEAGMEPGDEAVDVVDRQPEMLAQGARIRRHVGALEQHGAGPGVAVDQCLAGVDDVLLGRGDVEDGLVADDDAAEFVAAVGPDD